MRVNLAHTAPATPVSPSCGSAHDRHGGELSSRRMVWGLPVQETMIVLDGEVQLVERHGQE